MKSASAETSPQKQESDMDRGLASMEDHAYLHHTNQEFSFEIVVFAEELSGASKTILADY